MIYKGLDDEEAGFLNFVVDQHASHFREMMNREREELTAYRVYNNIYFSDISIYNPYSLDWTTALQNLFHHVILKTLKIFHNIN